MPAVAEITNIYQQVRFGDRTLGDDEIARVSLLLGELKTRPPRRQESQEQRVG